MAAFKLFFVSSFKTELKLLSSESNPESVVYIRFSKGFSPDVSDSSIPFSISPFRVSPSSAILSLSISGIIAKALPPITLVLYILTMLFFEKLKSLLMEKVTNNPPKSFSNSILLT